MAYPLGPIFDGAGVQVTPTMVTVFGTSYPVQGLTSVRTTKTPPSRVGGGVLVVVGLLLLLSGQATLVLFGLVLGALGAWLLVRAKAEYHLVLGTAAGERQALSSKDEQFVQSVRHAVSTAVATRG